MRRPELVHVDEDTHAPLDAFDVALDLRSLSDGRPFEPAIVAGEINHFIQAGVRCAYEIGRRLLWAKKALPHGQFGHFLGDHLPYITERSCTNYMRTAEFLMDNPRLLATAEQVGIKKTLLLAQLPPDELDELTQGGRVADVDLEGINELPYIELRRRWKDAEKRSKVAELAVVEEKGRAEKAEGTLANIVEIRHGADDDAQLARLVEWRKVFDGAMSLMGMGLDAFAVRIDEGSLSPRIRAEVMGFVAYMATYTEYESLRFKKIAGDDVLDYQLDEVTSRPRPRAESFALPSGRVMTPDADPEVDTWDDGPFASAKKNRNKRDLKVVTAPPPPSADEE